MEKAKKILGKILSILAKIGLWILEMLLILVIKIFKSIGYLFSSENWKNNKKKMAATLVVIVAVFWFFKDFQIIIVRKGKNSLTARTTVSPGRLNNNSRVASNNNSNSPIVFENSQDGNSQNGNNLAGNVSSGNNPNNNQNNIPRRGNSDSPASPPSMIAKGDRINLNGTVKDFDSGSITVSTKDGDQKVAINDQTRIVPPDKQLAKDERVGVVGHKDNGQSIADHIIILPSLPPQLNNIGK